MCKRKVQIYTKCVNIVSLESNKNTQSTQTKHKMKTQTKQEQVEGDNNLATKLEIITGSPIMAREQREVILPYDNSVLIFSDRYVVGNSYQDVKKKIEDQGMIMAAAPHAFTFFKYLIKAGVDKDLRARILNPIWADERLICFDTVLKGFESRMRVIDNPGTDIENDRGELGYNEKRYDRVIGLDDSAKLIDKLATQKEFLALGVYPEYTSYRKSSQFDGKDGDFLFLRPNGDHRWANLELGFPDGREYITTKGPVSALAMADPSKNPQYFKAAYQSLVNLIESERETQSRDITLQIKNMEARLKQLGETTK